MSWRVQRSRQPVDLDLRPSALGRVGGRALGKRSLGMGSSLGIRG